MTKLCVIAPSGRMGAQVAMLASELGGVSLSSALVRDASERPSYLASEVLLTNDVDAALTASDVYIDFSTPALSEKIASAAMAHKTAAVVGTTGLDKNALDALAALSQVVPVFVAANFSPGVALVLHLAEIAARALGPDYDMEVLELHHRNKVDSPSGTALALGKSLAQGRGIDFEASKQCSRDGMIGPRGENEIGLLALRGGDIVGEHTAYLIADQERIEITHRAQKRSVFAHGALRAARWLSDKTPAMYGMADLLRIGPGAN